MTKAMKVTQGDNLTQAMFDNFAPHLKDLGDFKDLVRRAETE